MKKSSIDFNLELIGVNMLKDYPLVEIILKFNKFKIS